VTSSSKYHNEARRICSDAGLSVSGQYDNRRCHAVSYRKRGERRDNFLRVGGDNWICFAGTFIMGGDIGYERLGSVYEVYREEGVVGVRKRIFGHYAFAIKQQDRMVIFTDPQGALFLYYVDLDGNWFASNSLHLSAAGCSVNSVDSTHLLATALESNLPGTSTFYPDIKRLHGDQVLRIDIPEEDCGVRTLSEPNTYTLQESPSSVSEASSMYAERVRGVFEQISQVGSIGVMATGGLDSRTVLAGLLDQGVSPRIFYGKGDSVLTNTKDRDRQIARGIADRFGLEFEVMDWADEHPKSRRKLRELFRKYGFKYEVYGALEGWVKNISSSDNKKVKITLGGYSSVFTNKKPWENIKESKKLEKKYAKKEIYKNENFLCGNKSLKKIRNSIEEMLTFKNEKEKSGRLETYLEADKCRQSRFSNFINEFKSYIDPFNTKNLYMPLVKLNPKFRKSNKVQVRVIKDLESEILKEDIFSGLKETNMQSGRIIKENVSSELKKRGDIKKKVSKYIPSAIKRMIKNLLVVLRSGKESGDQEYVIREGYMARLEKEEIVSECFENPYLMNAKVLARLEYLLVGVHTTLKRDEDRHTA
jgi:hypothetical protein